MAPKRSRASRASSSNPASGASSSNPAQSPDGFPDYEALRNLRNRRREILANRGFVHGREVNLEGIGHYDTFESFKALGWDTFLFKSCVVSPQHIREFYAGYNLNEAKGNVELQLYDNFYTWTINQFCSILGLPRASTKIYTTSSSLSTMEHLVDRNMLLRTIVKPDLDPTTLVHLNDQVLPEGRKLWNKIILANIFPRNGNTDRMAALQAYLLYCLVKGENVDVGYIVLKRMEGLELTTRSLPYGILLNRLFEFLELPTCLTTSPGKPINRLTISRMDVGSGSRERRWKEEVNRGNGVIRESSKGNGNGVIGESSREIGVKGEPSMEIGVNGESSRGNGVNGESSRGNGVDGESSRGTGVDGESSREIGMKGEPSMEIGVKGEPSRGNGVIGEPSRGIGVIGAPSRENGVNGEASRENGVDAESSRKNEDDPPASGPNANQFPQPASVDQFNDWRNHFESQFSQLQSDVAAVCDQVGGIQKTIDAQSNMLRQILDRFNRFS